MRYTFNNAGFTDVENKIAHGCLFEDPNGNLSDEPFVNWNHDSIYKMRLKEVPEGYKLVAFEDGSVGCTEWNGTHFDCFEKIIAWAEFPKYERIKK